jgi:hypothetical protein
MDLDSDKGDCPVCTETFNKSRRTKVTCGPCGFTACASCVATYLCAATADPHCMSCKRGWDTACLHTCGLSAAFINGPLRAHREALIWEREQAQLPGTQPFAENYKKLLAAEETMRLARQHFDMLKNTMNQRFLAHHALGHHQLQHTDKRLQSLMKVATTTLVEARTKYNHAFNVVEVMATGRELTQEELAEDGGKSKGFKRRFVQRCPAEGCNGFIDNNYVCGLCSTRICRSCRVAVGFAKGSVPALAAEAAEKRAAAVAAAAGVAPDPTPSSSHECNPDTLATVRALAADTRPCPGCATPIFKIDGCDQMWCTECHVTFSWKTGLQLQGAVHNPHYYQWMRQQTGSVPRTPGDIPGGGDAGDPAVPDLGPCGGAGPREDHLPFVHQINGAYHAPEYALLHRLITEIRANSYYMPHARDPQDGTAARIRAKFLVGCINQQEFKRRSFLWDRTRKRKQEVADVLLMFSTVGATILQRAAQTIPRPGSKYPLPAVVEDIAAKNGALLQELRGLVQYTNDSMAAIAALFGVMAMHIDGATYRIKMHVSVAPLTKSKKRDDTCASSNSLSSPKRRQRKAKCTSAAADAVVVDLT